MKILLVVPRFAPAWGYGGGVRMTYELARRWVADGHSVTVYTSDQLDVNNRCGELRTTIEGIEVVRFRNFSNFLASRYAFLFFSPRGLRKALSELGSRFDIVHMAESRGPHNRWVMELVCPQNVPIVWSCYGGLADGEGSRKLYRRVYDVVFGVRKMVVNATSLIAQTQHEKEMFLSFGARESQIAQIPLAVDWDTVKKVTRTGKFRAQLGVRDTDPLILFVGRIHWTKGLQILIPAFGRISAKHGTAMLAIVGWDHGYLASAKQLVADLGLSDRVHFPGPIFGDSRFSAYSDSDIFAITPEVYEETSLAALEASACGTGCIVTKQCEIPNMERHDAGLSVDANVKAVAQALDDGLQVGVAVRWGKNARRMVEGEFTTSKIAQSHERLFRSLIDSRVHGIPTP
jgi:glycosyltransferase involved in cell wall biosynthesis